MSRLSRHRRRKQASLDANHFEGSKRWRRSLQPMVEQQELQTELDKRAEIARHHLSDLYKPQEKP